MGLRLDWQHGPWRTGLRLSYSAGQLLPAATTGAPSMQVPALTLLGAPVMRSLAAGLELTIGADNLGNVRLADESPLYPQAVPPRTWRLALRGRW